MNLEALIADFTRRGIRLIADPPKLIVEPASKLTDEDRQVIRAIKPALLAYLQAQKAARVREAQGRTLAGRIDDADALPVSPLDLGKPSPPPSPHDRAPLSWTIWRFRAPPAPSSIHSESSSCSPKARKSRRSIAAARPAPRLPTLSAKAITIGGFSHLTRCLIA
jgi:hypothetical protein